MAETPAKTSTASKTTKTTETDASTGNVNAEDTPKLAPSVQPYISEDLPEIGPAPTTSEVPDPRTASDDFNEGDQAGYAGLTGFAKDGGPVDGTVVAVDPHNIPADVTTGVQPDSGGDRLLAAAQAKAPNLTAEFVKAYKLTPSDLGAIARGDVPPPPAIGPAHTSDLYLTPGGWVQTPPGITPEELQAQQTIRRR